VAGGDAVNALELLANGVILASIVLAGRNSVHTWWTGILGCALFGWVFFRERLYADVTLQVFFIASSAVGWQAWLHGRDGGRLPITRLAAWRQLGLVGIGALGALAYGLLLHLTTDAQAPFADSAVLAFSIVAQLLMMRRHLACWPFWLLVDSIAVPLYASRGLHLTAVLYAAFWLNALLSWRHWRRLMRREAAANAVASTAIGATTA